jgi:serine/threonine protein kinase
VVELTPEREYLLVTEFFAGATEPGEAQVDDQVIDGGLLIIRKLWEAGLAHRDIKPANLLVRHRQVLLIDVAFIELRPSPWRQAVDLANMMLCLALRSSRARVPAGPAAVLGGGDQRGVRRRPRAGPAVPAAPDAPGPGP